MQEKMQKKLNILSGNGAGIRNQIECTYVLDLCWNYLTSLKSNEETNKAERKKPLVYILWEGGHCENVEKTVPAGEHS